MTVFMSSPEGNVKIRIEKLILGTETHVFYKRLGSKFEINGQEIEEGDRFFYKDITLTETIGFWKQAKFIEDHN